MKKNLFSWGLAMLLTQWVFCQTFVPPAYADVDTNYRHSVNQVLGALEYNRVSTGLLMDYAFDFTDPKIYNGTVLVDSTLMEQTLYSDLYKTIFTSRVNTTAIGLRHPNIQDSLCYKARQREMITISGLLFKYNAIDPNAQTNGKMQTVNGQIKDVYVGGVNTPSDFSLNGIPAGLQVAWQANPIGIVGINPIGPVVTQATTLTKQGNDSITLMATVLDNVCGNIIGTK